MIMVFCMKNYTLWKNGAIPKVGISKTHFRYEQDTHNSVIVWEKVIIWILVG